MSRVLTNAGAVVVKDGAVVMVPEGVAVEDCECCGVCEEVCCAATGYPYSPCRQGGGPPPSSNSPINLEPVITLSYSYSTQCNGSAGISTPLQTHNNIVVVEPPSGTAFRFTQCGSSNVRILESQAFPVLQTRCSDGQLVPSETSFENTLRFSPPFFGYLFQTSISLFTGDSPTISVDARWQAATTSVFNYRVGTQPASGLLILERSDDWREFRVRTDGTHTGTSSNTTVSWSFDVVIRLKNITACEDPEGFRVVNDGF